jgi:hypothetical protein
MAATALAAGGSAYAVEYANIDVADGSPSNTATPTATIPAGQGTSNFFLDPGAVVGEIPIRIGPSATDDYAGGVLMGIARETSRVPADDAEAPVFGFSASVGTVTDDQATSANTRNVSGGLSLITRRAGSNVPTTMYPVAAPLNANVAAAYFPFSEGWQGGTASASVNGSFLDTFVGSSGITFSEVIGQTNTSNVRPSYYAPGQNYVSIPGVTDTRQQGILLAMSARNNEDFALVSTTANGDGWNIETKNNHVDGTGAGENNPFSFVFVPLGTPNMTMGVLWGGGDGVENNPQTILKSGANFTVTRDTSQNGAFRLHIDGQTPTSGTLLVQGDSSLHGAGGGLPGDNLVTYRADGNDWIIVSDDLPTANATNGQNGESGDPTPYFQFVFMPFNAKPTAPGAVPAPAWNKSSIWGYRMNMTEIEGRDNNNDDVNATLDETMNIYPGVGVYGSVAASSPGINVVPTNMNRGDPRPHINGASPTSNDGILFATIAQGLRDNSATHGINDYGIAGVYHTNNGWTVATSGADPSTGEANLNYAVAFFGANTGFTMGANAAHDATGLGTVTITGVNSQNDGVLMANNGGNEDNFVTVTPHADGSGWDVQNWDNGLFGQNVGFNYIYLPYTTQNLVAGRVNPDGTLINSTDTSKFTLTREATGSYLLTVNGRTPDQGMLLLSADATDGSSMDNTLVYEPAGNAFRILGIDMVSNNEQAVGALTSLEDTRFQFAFIDWITPPSLPGGNFLAADFNHDGLVNGTDLGTWKANYGTGTTSAQGDANGDSKVDGADFLVWQRQVGMTPASATAAAVPEPAAACLALVAGLGCGLRRRRSA